MADGLAFGERLPDFLRHRPGGEAVHAYDLADGREWLLVAAPRPDARVMDALLPALAAVPAGLRAVAVLGVPPSQLRALLGGRSSTADLLADDGAVSGWITGDAARLAVLRLDANQRVRERRSVTDPADLAQELAALGTLAPESARPVATLQGGAPALIVPRVLEPELCAELIALYDREGGLPSGQLEYAEGGTRFKVDPRYKSRHDYQRFDAAWTQRLSTLLTRRILPEVDKCFAFRADSFEPFKLSCYAADAAGGEAGYHRPHRDNLTPDVQDRRFALSVNLNTGDYEGGELRFPEYGPELFLPPAGAGVVFSSSMLHEAMPVRRGRRFVLLTFLATDRVRGPHDYHRPR